MGYVLIAAFITGWVAVVRAYGRRGIKGLRRQLLGFCGGIIALVVAAFIGEAIAPSKPAIASLPPSPKAHPEENYVVASAREIFAAYEENEVAADQIYKGRDVMVVGTVQSIDKDAFNNIVVRLQTPNQFMPVSVTLQDKYESEAARMKKSDILTFTCIGAGRIIGSPVLKNCSPVPNKPSNKNGKKA